MEEVEFVNDQAIDAGSPTGRLIGFTPEMYGGYLWYNEDGPEGAAITISVIEVIHKGQGHLKLLFGRILERGLIIRVPTPLPLMQATVIDYGFIPSMTYFKEAQEWIDTWAFYPEYICQCMTCGKRWHRSANLASSTCGRCPSGKENHVPHVRLKKRDEYFVSV